MKRLSHYTFFRKRGFPCIWIAFCSSFVVGLWFTRCAIAEDSGSSTPLVVDIMPFPPDESSNEVILRFSNTGKHPLRILKPIDGSLSGSAAPHYKFTVFNKSGRAFPQPPRCAHAGEPYYRTVWPDDYVVTIEPGKSFELIQRIPYAFPGVVKYNIRFEYTYDNGSWVSRRTPRAEGVWEGSVESKQIAATFCGPRSVRPQTDDEMFSLTRLQEITDVDCSFSEVTDKGVKHLAGLLRLKRLELRGTRVTDEGMAILPSLRSLRSLNVSDTEITDSSMTHLEGLNYLTTLNLDSTRVTGAGLRHLKGLTRLRRLRLYNTQVDDAGLAHLKGMNDLRTLALGGTRVTDGGLIHVKSLPRLDWISVYRTRITSEGLLQLRTHPRLTGISSIAGQFSEEDKSKIREAMPNVTIYDN
jgi:hypothetical protein